MASLVTTHSMAHRFKTPPNIGFLGHTPSLPPRPEGKCPVRSHVHALTGQNMALPDKPNTRPLPRNLTEGSFKGKSVYQLPPLQLHSRFCPCRTVPKLAKKKPALRPALHGLSDRPRQAISEGRKRIEKVEGWLFQGLPHNRSTILVPIQPTTTGPVTRQVAKQRDRLDS